MKLFKKLAVAAIGAVMALGVGIGVNAGAKGVPAKAADTTITSGDVVSNSSYAKYENNDAIITFGGNNVSVGTNSGNRGNCKLTNYGKYAVSPVTTSDVASAFVMKKSLSNIGEITYTFNGGSNQSNTAVYAIYSSDNNSFSQLSLTTGNQGHSISSGTTLKFSSCTGYFGLLFKETNSSGNWRIDNVSITFKESSGPVDQVSGITLLTDYADDNETTLDGGGTLEQISTTITYCVDYESGKADCDADIEITPTDGASFVEDKGTDSSEVTFTFTKIGNYKATITSKQNSNISEEIIYHVVNFKEKVYRTFTKVNNNSGLVSGCDYLLVCEDKKIVYNGFAGNTYGEIADVTISDGEITETDSMVSLKITSADNGYYISDGNSNLYYTGSSNALYLGDKDDNSAKWTINIVDGTATIKNVGTNDRVIKYNSSNPRFACYTSGQTAVQLYKEVLTTPYIEINKSSASLSVTSSDSVSNTVDLSVLFFNGATGNVTWTANNDNVSLATPFGENNKNVTVTAVKGGTSIVTASVSGYEALTCSISITKALKTLEVVTAPTKTSYNEGESFDPSGMVLKATYDDGTTIENITSSTNGLTWTPEASLDTTNTSIIISYSDGVKTVQTTQTITVTGRVAQSIYVSKMPTKTAYILGSTLDTTGIVVKAKFNFGDDGDITSKCTFAPKTLNTVGTQTITVTYGTGENAKTTSFDVSVREATGPLASGNYRIRHTENNTNYYLDAEHLIGGKRPAATTNPDDVCDLLFTLIDDNTYTITLVVESETYALYCINDNDGLKRSKVPSDILSDDNYHFSIVDGFSSDKVTDDGVSIYNIGQGRYVSLYNKADFRTYTTHATNRNSNSYIVNDEIEANEFASKFINGTSCSSTMSNWSSLALEFAALKTTVKNIFINAEHGDLSNYASDLSNSVENCVARYDSAIGSHPNLTDFMNRFGSSNASRVTVVDSTSTMMITVISLVSVSTIAGYFFLRKKKQTF